MVKNKDSSISGNGANSAQGTGGAAKNTTQTRTRKKTRQHNPKGTGFKGMGVFSKLLKNRTTKLNSRNL